MIKYIADEEHYSEVLKQVANVRRQLWIGTADIKDLYMKSGGATLPFVAVLADLVHRGVEIRLIHAKEPGPNFQQDFDRYPELLEGMERQLCPRVHFKLMVFDCRQAYIGSANLTGAGIGMKGVGTRNFEAGILTDEGLLVDQATTQFDNVWMGRHCRTCRRRAYCPDPIG